MLDSLRLYFRYLGISMRAQMQYRVAFIMQSLGQFLGTAMELAGLWAMFGRFGRLHGWTLPQVAFFYGLVNVSFAIAEAMGRGFDLFSQTIKAGEFDRLLLRPRSTVLQLAGQELTLKRVGRLAQGLTVLIWAGVALNLDWSIAKCLLLLATIAGGVCLFFGLVVLQATMCFWTTESLEFMNTMTYGGVETAQYPIAIYRPWFRKFFTFVVPLACVAYLPVLAILDRPDPGDSAPVPVQWLSPLAGFAFLAISLQTWRFGVKHYCSTGS